MTKDRERLCVDPTSGADAAHLLTPAGVLTLRRARVDDVPAVVRLLADDPVGSGREGSDLTPYLLAFERVDRSPAELLLVGEIGEVGEVGDGGIVATMQLTVLHGLSRRGSSRLQVEGVRVASGCRSGGIGQAMVRFAADWGRAAGCVVAQLTTDKRRTDAHRFYERLGWQASHEGMKLPLRD